jgi:pilus assembly protein CpaC
MPLPATVLPAASHTAQTRHLPERPAPGQPLNDIALSIGRGQLVTLPSAMKDVFVADDKVADVQVKSARQLYLLGKGNGVTSVYASNAAGQVIWSANLRVGANIDSVDQMLAIAMPDAHIAVATMGTNTVLLTGTVATPEDTAEAGRLVQAFMGKDANVITRLRTATPLQVNLQVRIAEVSRTLMRQLGSNLATQGGSSGFIGLARGRGASTITSGLPSGVMTGVNTTGMPVLDASSAYGLPAGSISLPFNAATGKFVASGSAAPIISMAANLPNSSALGFAGHLFGMDVLETLDVAEQVGLVTTLAQPNLTAISGETADFLAGGEFPIPMPGGLGTTSIEYKKFGVSLSYTPTVLADGRISLRVRPEVSELSANGAIMLNGYSIPSLTVRRTETTVELGSGQSFMIAGLLSSNASHTIEKLPGVGDVPVLGALFRSTSFQQGETELVIVVTPYLVRPVNDGDIKLPTDGYQSPDEIRQLLGDIVSKGGGAQRPGPRDGDAATGSTGPTKPGDKKPTSAPSANEAATPGFSQP